MRFRAKLFNDVAGERLAHSFTHFVHRLIRVLPLGVCNHSLPVSVGVGKNHARAMPLCKLRDVVECPASAVFYLAVIVAHGRDPMWCALEHASLCGALCCFWQQLYSAAAGSNHADTLVVEVNVLPTRRVKGVTCKGVAPGNVWEVWAIELANRANYDVGNKLSCALPSLSVALTCHCLVSAS